MVGIPALILEHSFHTNAYMTEWLLDEEKLDRMARAEATAIGEYFGMKKMVKEDSAEKLYRVQVGAFKNLGSAELMRDRLKDAGFDAYIRD